jgi:membrane protein DedA with SNARE-associated domain
MIQNLLNYLETLVISFGSVGIFWASFIEEFFAPIPSSIVMLSSGYAFMDGLVFNLSNLFYLYITVSIPVAMGIVAGSLIWYGLSYHYGEILVKRFGKYIGVSWSEIEKYQKKLEHTHVDEWALFSMRAIPILPSIVITIISGLMKVKLWTYITMTFLGTSIRATIIASVGWQLGKVYKKYAHFVDQFEKIGLILVIIIFITYVIKKKYFNKKDKF